MEEGVSVSLKNNEWVVSIGDVKTAPKSSGSSILRGTIIELHRTVPVIDDEDNEEQSIQMLLRDVLSKVFQGTGESFAEAKFIIEETMPRDVKSRTAKPADWKLAGIYMKSLRGSR